MKSIKIYRVYWTQLLMLLTCIFSGCLEQSREIQLTKKLEIPSPQCEIPNEWKRPVPFTTQGGETILLDGPETYHEHFSKGWNKFLFEYTDESELVLDLPFPCQPFSFTMAEGDGYDSCKSKIYQLEIRFGRDAVLAELTKTAAAN